MIKQDLSFSDKLAFYFKEWINGISIVAQPIISKELFNQSVFLNFNYTDTLERVYNIPAGNILYIHGKACSADNLIIGHHDLSGFQEERISAFNAAEEHGIYMDDVEEDVRLTEAKEIIKEYFKKTYKDTASILEKNQGFFDSLSGLNEIFILGHSLSAIDMDYFRKIREKVSPLCKWYISYHENKDIIRSQLLVKELNIYDYQLIRIENL